MTPAALSFARGVASRLSARSLLIASAVIVGLSVFSTLGLTVLWMAPANTVVSRLLETFCVGAAIFAAVQVADEAVDRGARRFASYGTAVLLGACAGAFAGYAIREGLGLRFGLAEHGYRVPTQFPISHRIDLALFGILIGGLATAVHSQQRSALAARRPQHAAEQRRTAARRRTIESELQALQARVEPTFLFDSLRRIRDLYETDRVAANAMLEDLIVYLRAALPHMRESTSTLGQELTLATAWIEIVRRGVASETAGLESDVAGNALEARLPALVLLPLVQHAAALREGRLPRLSVQARLDGGQLQLEVHSSDAAFAAEHASAALEPVRERLSMLYRDQARVIPRGPDPAGGSAVQVHLPFQPSAGDAA